MVDGLAHDHRARSGEENLLASLQGPVDLEVRVLCRCDRLARFLYVLVERFDEIFGPLVGVSWITAKVERCLGHGIGNPARHSCHELGEVSQRERFGMRLEFSFVGGNSLDHFASCGHFLVEFRQQCVSDAHVISANRFIVDLVCSPIASASTRHHHLGLAPRITHSSDTTSRAP